MSANVINPQVHCLTCFNTADETTGTTTKSLCTKLLMGSIKRNISAGEASYEISLFLYIDQAINSKVLVSQVREFLKRGKQLLLNVLFLTDTCHVTAVTNQPYTILFVNKARSQLCPSYKLLFNSGNTAPW